MGTKQKLDEDHAGGEPFYFRELGSDHPAREYARQVTGTDPGVTS
jgi:hypothetical protein